MSGKEAARGSGNYTRAKNRVVQTRSIVSNKDQAALAAGLMMAVLLGFCMLWAAVMW